MCLTIGVKLTVGMGPILHAKHHQEFTRNVFVRRSIVEDIPLQRVLNVLRETAITGAMEIVIGIGTQTRVN